MYEWPRVSSIFYSPRNYRTFADTVIETGIETTVGGKETYEIVNAEVILKNPLDRIIPDSGRKMNIGFGIAEWISMMTNINDVGFFTKFIKSYGDYSTDGIRIDNSYAERIAVERHGSQIEGAIRKLEADPYTRQAVVALYSPKDVWDTKSKHLPCTLTMQFLYRDGALLAITTMRSNDVVKGLTYDIFVNTLIHEYVAHRLGYPVGWHIHHANSLHVYKSDLPMIEGIDDPRWTHTMNEMPTTMSWEEIAKIKKAVLLCDATVGTPDEYTLIGVTNSLADQWSVDLVLASRAIVMRNKDAEAAKTAYNGIFDLTIRRTLRPWMNAANVGIPWGSRLLKEGE